MRKIKQQLLYTACIGDLSKLKRAIADGVHLDTMDSSGVTALHKAAIQGRVECLQELIGAGAKIDAVDDGGACALHCAAFYGHNDCLRALIAAGANVNALDADGWSALHDATNQGQIHCALTLLSDPNIDLELKTTSASMDTPAGSSARAIAERNGYAGIVAAIDEALKVRALQAQRHGVRHQRSTL